jgi:hypothetical protein
METNMTDLAKIQQGMFGCSAEAIQADVNRCDSAGAYVLSTLSDAQELIAFGRGAQAERLINRAKYVTDEFLVDRRPVIGTVL